jgi:hypothetical protein
MTALLSSGKHASFGLLTRLKSAVRGCVEAIEESRMHRIQREIEFHVRPHSTVPGRRAVAISHRVATQTTKPKSSVK